MPAEPSPLNEVAVSARPARTSRVSLALLGSPPAAGWRRYVIAVLAVAATASLRLILEPLLGQRLPFITLFFGIFVAAWYGGLGPALLATVLGTFISAFVFLGSVIRVAGFDRITGLGLLLFVLTGLATAWLGETRLRAMRLAERTARQAAAEADRADEERERAEDEATKAKEAAAEAELAAREAAEALDRQLDAEAALRRSQMELADFFENATIGLNWIGPDGVVQRANRAQLAMLGYAASEYVGRRFAELQADPAVADAMLARLGAREVVRELPSRMRCSDGDLRDVVIDASGHWDEGRMTHARCFVRDVTGQKRAEEAVRSLQRLESVGRLAGGMAHEVNNQMTVVLGATDFILRQRDVPAAARADVQHIRDAAVRSAGITAQLLAFGRRQILRPEVVDLNAAVAGFEPVLHRTMGDHYTIALELMRDAVRVRVDKGQLEQVLLNLALNAADAMPEGGRLTLRTAVTTLAPADQRLPLEPDVRPGAYVELALQDAGTGMEAAVLDRIFEPFFTTKPVGKGTGLGLSTVYGIVRQSGGYIAARSTLGRGSTFVIYLPVTAETAVRAPDLPAGIGRGRGEIVMIVEDKPEVRQMATRALREGGFAVIEAGDGVQALDLLADGHPDVNIVVTDLALPNMDGLVLAGELRRLRPSIPVLFMTGYTSDESVRRTATLRGHPLIEKPFTADLLVGRVREALDAPAPGPAA
jgi:two-component system, cell cycle sensor histidine kinase and response regulator CckA